ncbi:MAG: O-antigen/teichoic acid export membrane protein [Hyphomicrobiaceae bacterium]|jgi:O-antigen/teichoic acid export membrane protein
MSERRKLLLNAASMLVVGLLQRGMGLIGITLLARILDPRGLGAYAFTQSTGQACYGLTRLGADAGLHVGMANLSLPDDRAKAEALLGEGLAVFLGIAVVGTAVLLLLAETIARSLFAAPELTPFVAASAVFFVAQVTNQYCYTCLAGIHAFVAYARVMTMTSALVPILGVSGGLAFGAIGAVWGAAMAGVLTGLTLATLLFWELMHRGLRARLMWPSRQATRLLSVGIPFYAGGLILIPVDFLTIGLLSKVSGLAALGELRATQALTSIATMLPVAMSGPLISHLASKMDANAGPDAALVQLKAVWVFSIGIMIGLATAWPFVVVMIFGRDFALAQSVGILALIGLVPMMLLSVLTGALLAMQRSIVLFAVGGVQALFLGVYAFVLISDHGLPGLFVAQAAGMFAGLAVAMAGFAWQFDVALFRSWMVPLSVLTAVAIGLLATDVMVAEAVVVRLLIGLGFMSVLIVVVAKSVITEEERATIVQLMSSIRSRAIDFMRPIGTRG